MPRDDEDEDYDDAPGRRRSAPIPAGVKAAGVIWIGFGVLGLATAILSFMVTVAVDNGKGAGGICGVIIPIAFLIVGIQSVKGTAPGTMGNGIGSIIFGLLYLGIAVVVLASSALGAGAIAVVLGGLSALLGIALLTAGVLAIMGKDAYADWRRSQGLGKSKKKKKRRVRDEDDEDDDRDPPRKRPRAEADEAENDAPPRKRRRDEDDEDDAPPRKPRRDRDDDR